MINVSNKQWSVTWNEQQNELLIVPNFSNEENRTMIVNGRQATQLVALINAAMQLPSGEDGN